MGRVLVQERLGRVTSKEFRDDEQSDVLLAIEGFLKHMAAVTVRCELDNSTADDKQEPTMSVDTLKIHK